MKKTLLFLALIVSNFLWAQVGVGTDLPSPSAQLDIKSSNRGVLIPQIALTSPTDQTTISAGNVESLLVYNTSTTSTLTPGYYYWFQGRWQKLAVEANLPDNAVYWDIVNNAFTYMDAGGNTTQLDLTTLVRNLQTTTSLADGTNTTVESATLLNNTEYKVNVNTATGTTLGVVREAAANPTVKINAQGELSVDYTNLNTIVETSVSYTVKPNDAIVLGNANGGDVDITLPAATADNRGKKIIIKKEDSNEDFFVTIIGTIDGLAQLYTALPYSGWELISDGTEWKIINKF